MTLFPRICTGPRKPRRVLDEGEGPGDEEYGGEGEEEDLEAHQVWPGWSQSLVPP